MCLESRLGIQWRVSAFACADLKCGIGLDNKDNPDDVSCLALKLYIFRLVPFQLLAWWTVKSTDVCVHALVLQEITLVLCSVPTGMRFSELFTLNTRKNMH
jgi:hypothetical protein